MSGSSGPALRRSASVALRGDGSSGRTTLVLRLAAEAQATGAIVAWLDLSRSFDPVEAVARGIRLEWLVVITPETLDEGQGVGQRSGSSTRKAASVTPASAATTSSSISSPTDTQPPRSIPNGHSAMRLLHLFQPHLPLQLARARASAPFPPGPLVLGG